ncbi:MAG: NTP transferase domain-containing protein [Bdellovibrio sp.]|nr:NTP transferase domain-containing protein [Bdellovibrio sp.]
MQVIVTMAGKGQRFLDAGFVDPKPLVEVGGKPAIQYLIEAFPATWKLFFVIGEHFRTSDIEEVVCNLRPDAEVVYTDYSERGPVDTILAALPLLENEDEPVIVTYCDYTIIWDAKKFEESVKGYDAAVVSYQGFHPTYLGPNSYCHLKVVQDRVFRLKEKAFFTEAIETEVTSAGLYYFKSVEFLGQCLASQVAQDLNYHNEFYTSLALQAAIFDDPTVKILNYPISHMVQFGAPEDIERFEFWYKTLVSKSSLIEPIAVSDYAKEEKYWREVFEKIIPEK